MIRIVLVLAILFPSVVFPQTKARPRGNGFYVETERGWLPLKAYAEVWAAGEILRLVNGSDEDIPQAERIARFAVQMPNWITRSVIVAGRDLFETKLAERRTLTFGTRRTSIFGQEVNVGGSDPASVSSLLAQVGVKPEDIGYMMLVVGTEGFPPRYYPVKIRRGP